MTQGDKATAALTAALGAIGSNHYKEIPAKSFGKENYPLPRDIIARTLGQMGTSALPELLKILDAKNLWQLSEAIDAIGYICFYHYQPDVFEQLASCCRQHIGNDLIRWKILRAMSAFPDSVTFLSYQLLKENDERIKKEITRSLRLVKKRYGINIPINS